MLNRDRVLRWVAGLLALASMVSVSLLARTP